MKIRRLTLFFLVLLTLIATIAYAHSGGTDEQGGHINRSTGEYHYHHGYSAHQHSDMDGDGVDDCPHDFKDNTIQKDSSPPKNEKEKQSDTVKAENKPESNSYKDKASLTDQNKSSKVSFSKVLLFALGAWYFIGVIIKITEKK